MTKLLLIGSIIAAIMVSMNTVEIKRSDAPQAERVQAMSGNNAVQSQLQALELEGF